MIKLARLEAVIGARGLIMKEEIELKIYCKEWKLKIYFEFAMSYRATEPRQHLDAFRSLLIRPQNYD